ncbi:hypothetical protein F5Y12DRAFT_756789 [Xylaria sp. FL1777]|nr:hypothetical protein F5Y12DRAFT_756789 [Xylaria sp. FL1777]
MRGTSVAWASLHLNCAPRCAGAVPKLVKRRVYLHPCSLVYYLPTYTCMRAHNATTLTILSTPGAPRSDTMTASNGGQGGQDMKQDAKRGKPQLSDNEETAEEQQLQRDLKHLDLLLVKCRDMRSTIPRMLSGMPEVARNNPESLEAMFGALVNHMKSAGIEIQDFATLYTSEENKKVLEKARKSRAANPKGIKTWLYKDHPDWADVPR